MAQHRRGPWAAQEDRALKDLIAAQGPYNWVKISQLIGTRSPKQCRERWHQNLKPSLNHDPITPDEGKLIEKLVKEMGKRWAEIARQLPNRSDNAVKNWWNGGQNRRRRDYQRRSDSRPQHLPFPQATEHIPVGHFAHPTAQTSIASPQDRQVHPIPYSHFAHSAPAQGHIQAPSLTPYSRPSPQPLDIGRINQQRNFHYQTPQPSPSSFSEYAPSLVTDDGSETRSPHPHLPLPNGDRRRSSLAFLPPSGFTTDSELHIAGSNKQEEPNYSTPGQPEPYRPGRPALLLSEPRNLPAPQPSRLTTTLGDQRQLPAFETLTRLDVIPRPVEIPTFTNPFSQQPVSRKSDTRQYAYSSPNSVAQQQTQRPAPQREERMALSSLLS